MPDFLSAAKQAALEAGKMVKAEVKKQHKVYCKGGFDFATEVDRMSENLIREMISRLYPDHCFFCEEQVSGDGVPEDEILKNLGEYTWVVDALDGTTNFIRGIPQFAISVALLHHGQVQVGVVYDPSRDELFAAEAGKGATLNGEPIHVSTVVELKQSIMSYGFPASDLTLRSRTLDRVQRIAMEVGSVRVFNCAALLLCYVACGRTDFSWEEGLHLWDMAAGILLVREAGGCVSRIDGSDFTVFSRDNLAGNPQLHKAFLSAQA